MCNRGMIAKYIYNSSEVIQKKYRIRRNIESEKVNVRYPELEVA